VALVKADLAAEEGRFPEARRFAETAVAGLRRAGNSTAAAELVLARALLRQREWQGAAGALARARQGTAAGDLDLGLRAELTGLELEQGRSQRCPGGRRGAEELAARAKQHGFARTALEARMLAAACARSAGDEATAQAIAREIAAEAQRTGWRRFAIGRNWMTTIW
jgi:hypothetical protein